ncbi:hypothetical protein GH714_024630 [Hevea brasiliensis]|uniref:Uncharacterized protein n=1 Tax=Hevea brasiliensis TaxID=3981 RepID=A0A6A6KR54_HEVBR|nr:hypothetical protein GH714_024630 [Hevea brasiliensis]
MAKAPSPWLSLPPAESPLSPSPSSGSPAPSMDDDCTSVLYDMVDCIPYLSVGTNEQLDPSCCDGFKTVVAINIKCICEGLKNSAQLGIVLNMTRATLLPSAWGLLFLPSAIVTVSEYDVLSLFLRPACLRVHNRINGFFQFIFAVSLPPSGEAPVALQTHHHRSSLHQEGPQPHRLVKWFQLQAHQKEKHIRFYVILGPHELASCFNLCYLSIGYFCLKHVGNAKETTVPEGVACGNGYINGVVSTRSTATISEVDEFCYAFGGKRPIHSILISNNGMAAVKFIRSIRTWAYETFGTEKAILLVAMATPEDMRINAEHIRIADQFVEVPGGTNNNNYANVQLIVEMAEITRVDAVWPGWGHASENPELPDALHAKGIVFLGPPATSMGALGDKIGSSLIAQAADVPTLPWSVKISPESCLVTIPDEVYREACVYTTEEAIASCQVVGYPAMIKASWGGGGKGIRKVHNDDEVRALFKQVQGEVPGSPIFIMKVASQSRHLEVQLLCDQYGNVAALHSRDCSVQRRHQKIIEEGPITVAPLETVKKLEQAARRLAKCVNYVGAATVEYLYSMDTGEYYFLELNPRLQVEHPVTEWIAEINLPAAQVAIGMGIPLWQLREIRRFYGKEHGGGYDAWRKTSVVAVPFDFDQAESARPKGHCVAVRVTSEDPDDGFKPTSGKVQELSFKSKPNVWAYFSVKSGGGIHEFSDSQFGWLDSRIAMRVRAERPPWYLSVVGGSLYKASASSAAMVSDYVGYLEKGQIPPKHISLVNSQVSLNIEGSKYMIDMVRGGPGSYRLRMNESEIEAEIHTLRDGGLLMQLDGNSHVIYAEEEAAGTCLLIDGRTCLLQNEHDPSKLVAETPCKLLRYLVSDGSHIEADTPFAEVEVMKMCMPLLSPASGVIQFKMSEGQAMQAGELIARLDLDDPSAVRKAEPFHGSFPVLGPPTAISGKVHQRCAASLNAARMILAGYDHNIDEVVQNLLNCLDSPELPFLQWQECLSVLATRLPKDLRNEAHLSSCPEKEKGAQERLVEPLMSLVKSYEGGRESHALIIVQSLFAEYLSVEELFSDNIKADVIERLRLQYKKDLLKVVDIVLSHQGIRSKNKLILQLMEQLVYPNPAAYRDKLIRDHTLQRRVVETYVQRLYQPYLVRDSVRMQWHRSGLIASWEFMEEHIGRKNGFEDKISDEPVGRNTVTGNAEPCGDEDQAQERINKLAKILKEQEDKLKGYGNIQYTPSRDRQWHLYTVVDKPAPIQRMFLRTLVRQPTTNEGLTAYQGLGIEAPRAQWAMSFTSWSILRSLVAAMEELELNVHNATVKSEHAHMYLCILREQRLDDLVPYPGRVDIDAGQEEAEVERILEELAREIYASVGVKMHRLNVCEWEVKLWMSLSGQANGAWRVVITNVTGHTCAVHIYRELEDTSKHGVVYHSISACGPLHGVMVNAVYQPLGVLDRKRLLARRSNTTYCYDFPLAFETALEQIWASQLNGGGKPKDNILLKVTELVFADQKGSWGTRLVPVERPAGLNDVGMVAWSMEMSTPEFPSGRTILIVANDVTFKAGSFGPREDAFFFAVTDLACTKKLPLIYLAANSGARIGVAEEVKSCFKVGWSDESCPERGFQYVYLSPEDYTRIGSSVIAHELKLTNGETRWVIEAIVGKEDGLGVENLSGSGAIASAYSRAYKETFTLTYVTGRTVGIGAYLARLGMRCIQRLDQPIILTGFSALNKLLGREVYSSHMQLGGPKIMATNGVVHLTVSDDLEGVSAILKWLSCISPYIGGTLPILSPSDPTERPVEYFPENSCDPRAAICGALDNSGKWLGGIFDRNSFVETLEGWARTVVTGRAKLGGIPVGIIAVETQTVMQVIPADPGQLDSHEKVVPQAGQVWFPDSATKTAQAILDFNREEIPLFILANWRGFSGGQRDLFEGILQAGSTIVENLRTYKQPVFVYIPMMGELRGGAWVVVDSQINSDHIEMYADRTAKGNVLEPEGIIEIKFRTKELLECMGRLDQQLITLKAKLQEARNSGTYGMVESIQQQIKSREKQLLPVYTQIATRFAELHDSSLRMAAKGVIREVVDWGKSRGYFYKRLRRRIAEDSLIKTLEDAAGDHLSYKSAMDLIRKWFLDSDIAGGREDSWGDDEAFFAWKDHPRNYEEKLQELRVQKVLHQLTSIGESRSDLKALPQGLAALLRKVDPSSRGQLIDELRKVLN